MNTQLRTRTTRADSGNDKPLDIGTLPDRNLHDAAALIVPASLISGTAGDDTLVGSSGDDVLDGLGGLDYLRGARGADDLYGGSADDTLDGGPGADWLDGGSGSDTADYYYAGGGVTVDLSYGWVSGGDGRDTLSGIENVAGSAYDDVIYGDNGGNWLRGDEGRDLLHGDGGNDTLEGGPGEDVLDGGSGFDMADYYYADGAVTVDLLAGEADGGAGFDALIGIEDVAGSAYADSLYGDGADNWLFGDEGNDRLSGDSGNDTLEGGPGSDELVGGAGYDVADYYSAGAAVFVSLQTGTSSGGGGQDTLTSVEDVSGSFHADTIYGDGTANYLFGDAGGDTLVGAAGADTLDGGPGVDSLAGGTGNDTYVVDRAGDVVREYASGGIDLLVSRVTRTLVANQEDLTLTGKKSISGFGNNLDNILTGNAAGNLLVAGSGDDTLFGGGGADTLRGGAGFDELTGGGGADRFVFDAGLAANEDMILGFVSGSDRLLLDDDTFGAFNATHSTMLAAGQFVQGAGLTSAQDADDRIVHDTSSGVLYYDADGQGGAVAQSFAVLGAGTGSALAYTDFVVVG